MPRTIRKPDRWDNMPLADAYAEIGKEIKKLEKRRDAMRKQAIEDESQRYGDRHWLDVSVTDVRRVSVEAIEELIGDVDKVRRAVPTTFVRIRRVEDDE